MATQRELERINAELEQRVDERTQELLAAKQAEERAHISKTKFFAAVSHDLMQPFNAATLFCDMLRQRINDEQKQLVIHVQQSLQNAEELLTMLLDMTRLEAGNLPVHKQQVALHDVLQPLIDSQQVIAAEKQLSIHYIPSSAVLYTDRKLLSRIVQNLLSNAVRYTDSGRIIIGGRRRGQHLQLHIIDTGRGIPADQRDNIFREFHQLEQAGDNPGLGLGLAIVERMCRLLTIPLDLQSELGVGTRFSLTLPVQRWQSPQQRVLSHNEAGFERFLQGKRLWVVDNDSRLLAAVAQLLTDWGAEVFSATGREHLPSDAATCPDLVILDYHLDGGDTGIEVLKALRQRCGVMLPAIINSADPDEQLREQAIAEQALFMPKPLKTAALKRSLKRLLR
ncbi:MAG: Sensor histidine kinase RcsC [Pseudidiomarina mangrovi]|nr:MAG: Sensor histidine kinase RcsC [Pseudidiomarina mangrovi]